MTSNEEKFCRDYVGNHNELEAYKFAYNTSRLKRQTIERKASALLNRHDIQIKIKSLTSSQNLIDNFEDRYLHDAPRPQIKRRENEEDSHHNHPSDLEFTASLSKAAGSPDRVFMDMLARQLSKVVDDDMGIDGLNELLSTMSGISPKDEVEGMLAAQMVAVHTAIMKMGETLLKEPGFLFQNNALNHLTKLMRTFTQQIETLNKCRGKSHQRMTVEHVHVHNGGQAIVGQVAKGERVSEKIEEQPYEQVTIDTSSKKMRR